MARGKNTLYKDIDNKLERMGIKKSAQKSLDESISMNSLRLMQLGIGLALAGIVFYRSNQYVVRALIGVGCFCIVASLFMLGRKMEKVVASTTNRFIAFFKDYPADRKQTFETNDINNTALLDATETVGQVREKLKQIVEETNVILNDENSNNLIKLTGRGQDVAAAIKKGIKERRFNFNASAKAEIVPSLLTYKL